jgi:putative transposase
MTQNSDPYENAVAERINGILKQEFYINKHNKDLSIMKEIIKETLDTYNEKKTSFIKPHANPKSNASTKKLIMKTYKTKNNIKTFLMLLIYLFLSYNLYRLFRTSHFVKFFMPIPFK